jgi:fused signal recognition particle receptor
MAKSRAGLLSRLANFFSGKSGLDTSMLDDLEEALIVSDVGVRCATDLVAQVRELAEKQGTVDSGKLRELLKTGIRSHLVPISSDHRLYTPDRSPLVVLVVGVNGVGKTTTVAKLATKYMQQGKKVLAIAADTFRAAAVEQLAEWSNRVGFTLIRGAEEAKPSAVVFDGMVAAKEGGYDVVLIDTAGRLHTKSNLMQELEGIRNVVRKHVADGPHETILVLDGVSGQNALSQAREFHAAVQLSGIVVTKLDGTPKGGIIVAISQELKLPVVYVGVGEKVNDLIRFDPEAFVSALLDEEPGQDNHLAGERATRVGNT